MLYPCTFLFSLPLFPKDTYPDFQEMYVCMYPFLFCAFSKIYTAGFHPQFTDQIFYVYRPLFANSAATRNILWPKTTALTRVHRIAEKNCKSVRLMNTIIQLITPREKFLLD